MKLNRELAVTALLVSFLALALSVAGCTVAFKLTDTGLNIEWPKAPSIPSF